MKNKIIIVISLIIPFFLYNCEKNKSNEKIITNIEKIGIAYALGGKGDLSYNDAAYQGVLKLRKEGINVREFEPNTLDDYSKGLDLLSLGDLQIIYCIGYLYDDPVQRIAKNYPNIIYVVLDGSASSPQNVVSVKFNAYEGSILAGVVAGKLSKTNKIAFIGGADIPIINEFLNGFTKGVKLADPLNNVSAYYIGSGGTAFTDPVKGREVALTAINKGNDVIYHAAGSSGNGIIKAASEKNIFAIGVDVDQSHLAPQTVVTSMVKNFATVMIEIKNRILNKKLIGGKNNVMGLEDNAVGLAPMSDEYSTMFESILEETRRKILAGNY